MRVCLNKQTFCRFKKKENNLVFKIKYIFLFSKLYKIQNLSFFVCKSNEFSFLKKIICNKYINFEYKLHRGDGNEKN